MCKRDARAVDEALPELLRELRIERADPLRDRLDVVHEERPAREVERDLHERLVERHQRVREAAHADACRRAPRGAPGRARCRRLRPCGAGRPRDRPSRRSRGRSPRACRAARACGRRTGCRSRSSWCRGRRRRARGRSSSPSSPGGARLSVGSRDHLRQDRVERGKECVVLVGRADRDAQATLDARPRREVAHQHAPIEQALPQVVRVAVDAGRARSSRPTARPTGRASRRAPRRAGRAPPPATRRAVPSRGESRARRCPRSASGTESVYGSKTFSSSAITHGGATAKPRRTAASDHTFE